MSNVYFKIFDEKATVQLMTFKTCVSRSYSS